jgi:hypothetical protein
MFQKIPFTKSKFQRLRKKKLNIFFNKKLEKEEEGTSQNEATEDYIFPTGKVAPTDVFPSL